MKVNISDFQDKYLKGALIPEDIMAQFVDCSLRGETEAEIRDTVFEEMKIEQFYQAHPNLRPKTEWEVITLSAFLIDLMKSFINREDLLTEKADELARKINLTIDKYKVNQQPTSEIEYLYETTMWLKEEIYKLNEQ
ncbi:MAG: hypothetical protein J5733_05460 [Bacteroidaceae bacterium]|nr:hypothetical protein [Bacteroidaceae bacterium]